jgi:predicted exporter
MDTGDSGRRESDPEPIRQFRGQGWFNVWGVLFGVFVGLLCACAYWIVQLGFRGALDNSHFGYEAFFAAILGVVLIGRWSVPRLILDASSIDPRNAALMYRWPRGWFSRRWLRDNSAPDGEDDSKARRGQDQHRLS